jgi:hypothetical protein
MGEKGTFLPNPYLENPKTQVALACIMVSDKTDHHPMGATAQGL